MTKPTKKVWKPTVYEIQIGDGDYIVEPQPIERILEFDETVNQLMETISSISNQYFVVDLDTGEDVHGPFEDEEKAIDLLAEGQELRTETPTFKQIAGAIIGAPYPALKCLIPDLKEEDVRRASLPNLKYALDAIIEVNGVEWFESFLKKSLAPLVPEIIGVVTKSAKTALEDSTTPSQQNGASP